MEEVLLTQRRMIWDEVFRRACDDAVYVQEELLSMMEEGKIDPTSPEDLSYFLELSQEEKAIENRSLYKRLFKSYQNAGQGVLFYTELHQLVQDALQESLAFVPQAFSALVQQSTAAAAQTLQHMSENYDREITPEDLEQIRGKLQSTEAEAIASMQGKLEGLLARVDDVATEMFGHLDTTQAGYVDLAHFLDSYHHVSNKVLNPNYTIRHLPPPEVLDESDEESPRRAPLVHDPAAADPDGQQVFGGLTFDAHGPEGEIEPRHAWGDEKAAASMSALQANSASASILGDLHKDLNSLHLSSEASSPSQPAEGDPSSGTEGSQDMDIDSGEEEGGLRLQDFEELQSQNQA